MCLHIKRLLSAHGLWWRICLESIQTVFCLHRNGLWLVYEDDIMLFEGELGREIPFSPLLLLACLHLWIHFTFIILGLYRRWLACFKSLLAQLINIIFRQPQRQEWYKAKCLAFESQLAQNFLSNVKTFGFHNNITLAENPNIHQWRKHVPNVNSTMHQEPLFLSWPQTLKCLGWCILSTLQMKE